MANRNLAETVRTMQGVKIGGGEFWLGDCLERMADIPDGSVDMILCDLPYGTTACKWDTVIPFEPLWEHYWRVAKPNAAVVLTASQPFTSALVMSQVKRFKYEWIWQKDKPSNFALANRQPMKYHESICIFAKMQTIYNKAMEKRTGGGKSRVKYAVDNSKRSSEHLFLREKSKMFGELKNPSSVQYFNTGRRNDKIHPTQKPVALFEYLIRTYTEEGMTVLDNCAGSGTTAVAAERTGRRWLCIERDPDYYEAAVRRVQDSLTLV